jgi:hypothetical protein
MMTPHPHRPETPDLLEVERRVPRVLLKTLVGIVRQPLNVAWQRAIARPEVRRCVMAQRALVCPDA